MPCALLVHRYPKPRALAVSWVLMSKFRRHRHLVEAAAKGLDRSVAWILPRELEIHVFTVIIVIIVIIVTILVIVIIVVLVIIVIIVTIVIIVVIVIIVIVGIVVGRVISL